MAKRNSWDKIYHKAGLIGSEGQVSAVCFKKPHAIDLRKAGWTLEWKRATCPKCLALKPDDAAVGG